MAQKLQLDKSLEWHVIYGAPYFIREEREGVFNIVYRTSTILNNEVWSIFSELDDNFEDLVVGEDIEEFFPENNDLGVLVVGDNKTDLKVIRGLRHLARLEKAMYVSFKKIGPGCYYGSYVPSLKSDLVLARFFNRKYDLGIDPHAV